MSNKQTIYSFNNFFHPFVGEFIKRLNKGDLEGFMRSDLKIEDLPFFDTNYNIPDGKAEYKEDGTLNDADYIVKGFPKTIDLSPGGAYAIYNWEIFYHVPITVATHLSKNQRYLDAQKWFHFVFNPLTDEEEDENNPTARYWNFKYFREHTDPTLITKLMEELAQGKDTPEIKNLKKSIDTWREIPFNPHEIAKFRPLAYQFDVVMKYIDNLVAWGDSLFRQFTIESLNEATQLYVLASNILGDKPQKVPKLNKREAKSYSQIKNNLDAFGNVLVEMETDTILHTSTPNGNTSAPEGQSIFNIAKHLYFCIPENPKLMAYWDLVADRLFKIRHCMDIEGNVRQIPLFQPSIDPGMLVKAAASGMDVGDIIGGLNQPVSHVKFPVIAQKASELIGEVRAMGSMFLSAIEKGEAEKLTLIRQSQELKILGLSQDIRYLQWKESEAGIASLLKSRESAYERYKHYQILLGKEEGDFSDLETLSVTKNTLTEENFDDVYDELVSQYGQSIDLEKYGKDISGNTGIIADSIGFISGSIDSLSVGSSKTLQLNAMEDIELNTFMPLATATSLISGEMRSVASVLSAIPQGEANGSPLGVGVTIGAGGIQLSAVVNAVASQIQTTSDILNYQGTRASKLGSYKRRIDDWVFQNNLAAKELQQIGTQLISSLIRAQISKKEYENHKVQIENSKAIDTFLKEEKFANEELHLWMQGEIYKVYHEFYKLAFDTAKKAEATMKYELMREELDSREFIKFNYWDSGRKGLLAGEALALDMKRMEVAYMESNKREYELTKHISLSMLDPLALVKLRETGVCDFNIPEALYDMDHAGQYFRRIKSVSISMPCITGSYTSVSTKLSLISNKYRKNTDTSNGYMEVDEVDDDSRFKYNIGAIQSIATSSAQNDSGIFELNFRDERYLPFEGTGAISSWRLELPTEVKQFDYSTISDVILHVKYTAREGGSILKEKAEKTLKNTLTSIQQELSESGLHIAINMKHDMSTAWHQLKTNDKIDISIDKSRLPYFVQSLNASIEKVLFIAKLEDNPQNYTLNVKSNQISLAKNDELTLNKGETDTLSLNETFEVSGDVSQLEELLMVVKYTFS